MPLALRSCSLEKGRNRRPRSSRAMPIPRSPTLTIAVSRSRRTERRTSPPAGEYLTAFERRFSSTSAIRPSSAQAGRGSSGTSTHQRVGGVRAEVTGRLPRARREVHEAEVEGELAGLEAGRLERPVHQRRHPGGGADDRLGPGPSLVDGGLGLSLEQLRPPHDGGEGRAEVVGHHVHELALRAVELDEARVRVLERLVERGGAQEDPDPVGQRLQGDHLPPVERPRPVALDVEDGRHLAPGEDRDGERGAGALGLGREAGIPLPRGGGEALAQREAGRAVAERPSRPALVAGGAPRRRRHAEELLPRGQHRHQARAEGLLDPPHRHLEDPLPREHGRRLAQAPRSRARAARCAPSPRRRPRSSRPRSTAGPRSASGTPGRRR